VGGRRGEWRCFDHSVYAGAPSARSPRVKGRLRIGPGFASRSLQAMTRYTYGDSVLAAERLGLVARLFDPTSSAFVRSAGRPGVALDLGCGPGHSIGMVADAAGTEPTIGVERSEPFARIARAGGRPVVIADALAPLPARAVDLLYARLLLAHLPDPVATVGEWSAVLGPGGRILVDDLESIDTDEPAFRSYLDDVALAVIRAQGGALLVGPVLHAADDPPGLVRRHDEVAAFTPPAGDSARVFAMNLAVLVDRREVAPRPDLAGALEAIASGAASAAPVRWRVRQIAWERTG
jgi:trans-aconitate 2-methyltransferase